MTKIEALRKLHENILADYPEAKNLKMKLLRWNDNVIWPTGIKGKAGSCRVTADGYRKKEYLYSESDIGWRWY